ncbi:aminoacyl-tRNA deacylase [Gulosibacter molinativorax]|uniref:YbaK/aminoacyl-tRNA synthetase-associated domain-containing protein n=1 Tax=Gulosibacter molinativorax TaxID=256821 RepID=A0ABT7C6Q1_9MICO|nr:YbaK/EbsC family protein [Gulosibacter molinativorax]MDJ1370871.1 hypothetical protein [Gulosibacter molinativorax]QUY62208.1 Cys-tRNA(Pro)/Cys-tRNA(Cys) deacylase YbaK [Gulosibacter molinativorax]
MSTNPDLDPNNNPAVAAIQASGLPHSIREHGRASSLREAAEQRGITPRELIKSMVIKDSRGVYSVVLVPGDRVIAWAKLRKLLSVNKAAMPPQGEAEEITGFARGTITPFGTKSALPIIADERIPEGPISIGGGAHSVAFYLNGSDLLDHFGAVRLDITDPDPSFEN